MGALYSFLEVRRDVLPEFDDQSFALDLLENKHVLVAPGVSFNVPYRNCFRITNLPESQVLATVFARIEELLDAQAAARPVAAAPLPAAPLAAPPLPAAPVAAPPLPAAPELHVVGSAAKAHKR
jgi:hypothetical protein